jgi:protein-tyrosine phosphatase
VATPHLFKHRVVDPRQLNDKSLILERLQQFKDRLLVEGIDLEILPGCDVPLSLEALRLLEEDSLLTINDLKRYLLLELPDTSVPPALEDICFRLKSKGITPIITHPERHLIIQEAPDKLRRLVELGCLTQLTAGSLTGGFGRQAARISRQLLKKDYIHLMASDSHNPHSRPPELTKAVEELAKLVGPERAQDMVTRVPEKIIKGEPLF